MGVSNQELRVILEVTDKQCSVVKLGRLVTMMRSSCIVIDDLKF